MDDDDDVSPVASPSPASSAGALPMADPVTVAAAPPGGVMAVALPIHRTAASLYATASGSGGGGGGGGREDAWSEGATSTLIDAWGERFVALGRGSLRHPQWQEVAEVVSSRDGYSKPPKSDVQCKNRIDTLKKKYKVERSRHGASAWSYFDRLDDLLAPVYNKANSSSSAARNAGAAPMVPPRFSFPQRTRTPLQPSAAGAKRRMPSPPPQASASSDSSDGFPPEPPSVVANGKRQRMEGFPFAAAAAAAAACNGVESGSGSTSRALGLRDLAQAIRRLGEVYERVESSRRDQELRMERERLDAARELEDQRVQFFLKMQMELSKATGGGVGAPMAVAIPADGNGTRREGMTAEVATSSNHRVRYRIKGSGHHHAPLQPNYQNNAAPTGGGGDSDSDKKEAEENAQDEEEESQ